MRKITVQVPATITNLGPGLNTFGLAVKLYNYITIEEVAQPGYHVTNLHEAKSLPASPKENSVSMVVMDFLENQLKYKPKHGLHITNDFKIPLNRGFSSLHTAVVGGIIAASILAEVEVLPDDVVNILKRYLPEHQNFCATLLGGFVIGFIADERLVAMKIPFPEDLKLTLIIPEFDVNISNHRQFLPKTVPVDDAMFNLSRAALFVASICQREFKTLNIAMEDRLHQPYRRKKIPAADEVLLIARTCDTLGITLCGNGSSLLIIHKGRAGQAQDPTIKRILGAYERCRVKYQLVHTEVDEYGIGVVRDE